MEWAELEERAAEHQNHHRPPAPWREFVLNLRPGVPTMMPDLVQPGGAHPLTTKRRQAIRQAARKVDPDLVPQLVFAEDDAGNTWVGLRPAKRTPLFGRRSA